MTTGREPLPFYLPDIGEAEIEEVVATLRSGWLTTGPRTSLFEERFREYVGSSHAVAVSSGTAALHLALVAAGIRPGSEVITTPYTFAATAEVILHVGARPVFVDIDMETFNLDPARVREAITPQTKAILPVHIGGHPCDMHALLDIGRQAHLTVIEDAAHGLGAAYRGRLVGTLGDITAFSFYATKNITTGDGGMVTTESSDMADLIRSLRLHGLSRDAAARDAHGETWGYEIKHLGFKYNMTDILAAVGIHQLARIQEFTDARQRIVDLYNLELADVAEVLLPVVRPDVTHAWHLYIIRLALEQLSISRDEFINQLHAKNIRTSVHFMPLHLHQYFKERFRFVPTDFPHATECFDRVISLPLYTRMTPSDVRRVTTAIRAIVGKHRKRRSHVTG